LELADDDLGALEQLTATLRMAAANRRTNLGMTQSRIICSSYHRVNGVAP